MTERTLGEWLAYLEQLHPSAIDMGLERSQQVASRMGLGKPAPRVITVTGTNGKGSTCAFVASLLRAQGLNVGVYNSPHLLRYNERVQVNGVQATDAELCQAFAAVEAGRGDTSLTYFEMGTLAAFWLFQQAGLDAVVLEVGLGGRLDTVNVVDADMALVTSIGVDHADYLGDTRESVAFEKAGIFRQGAPALCGDLNPRSPCWTRRASSIAGFSCVDAISTWASPISTGSGAVSMPGDKWSSCATCRCSICRWKTPRWRCRPICCSVYLG